VDYERIARLGRGGMGVVDLARDSDGNRVALKRLTLQGSASEIARARQRLMREADVLSRLRHPNIVRLIEVVEDGDEVVLVMPYLSAGSLADRVTQHGPAPPADVERLGERLLGALAAAHQAGVIHRDIKPGNVLYDADRAPMLAHFGLAHRWVNTHGLTVTGMVVGTPG
jgi:eukaryotic-like serine/threonine-protein kinase